LARMCGCTSWAELHEKLERHRAAVSRHFEEVFAESAPQTEPWPEHERLSALRASQRYASLPADSRRRLDRLVPMLHRAAAATAEPEAAFVRTLDFVESIASRAA